MSTNQAAWLTGPKARPLQVKSADYPTPDADEVIVKVGAVGIDPVDNKIQDWNLFDLPFPIVLGNGLAGEVVAIGANISSVKPGQRVIANTNVLMSKQPKHGAYQQFTAVLGALVAPIPDSLSYESAAVLPVAMSTASAMLFNPEQLAQPLPPAQASPDDVLFIWGGSSSVGLSAIQLARHIGLRTIVTASPANAALCKSLGAAQVLDYHDADIVAQSTAALAGKHVIGALDAISTADTLAACADVLSQAGGSSRLVCTVPPMQEIERKGADIRNVFSLSILGTDVAKTIWGSFLGDVLAKGTLLAKPDAEVVGESLESVQAALDQCKKGTSAKKLVVKL